MRSWLSVIVDVALLCVCVAVGVTMFKARGPSNGKEKYANPVEVSEAVTKFPGLDLSQSDTTVVLFVDESCVYCAASTPFYKRLMATRQKSRHRVVAAAPGSIANTVSYFKRYELAVDEVVSTPLANLGVHATPTLVAFDRSGKILGSWIGRLNESEEAEVIGTLSR